MIRLSLFPSGSLPDFIQRTEVSSEDAGTVRRLGETDGTPGFLDGKGGKRMDLWDAMWKTAVLMGFLGGLLAFGFWVGSLVRIIYATKRKVEGLLKEKEKTEDEK